MMETKKDFIDLDYFYSLKPEQHYLYLFKYIIEAHHLTTPEILSILDDLKYVHVKHLLDMTVPTGIGRFFKSGDVVRSLKDTRHLDVNYLFDIYSQDDYGIKGRWEVYITQVVRERRLENLLGGGGLMDLGESAKAEFPHGKISLKNIR